MKMRSPLAVAVGLAAVGVAAAQPIQVFEKRAYPVQPSGEPTKPAEFKPSANTSPDPASLAVPEDQLKKARDLAGRLGSPDYVEREKATRELGTMGRMALPALQEVLAAAPEPEVAQRAEGLLPKAEAEDMKARVSCFLADAEGKYTHTLPGWEKFNAVAGSDKATRKLFAEALKSPLTHQMLLAADRTADEANAVLNQYMTKLWSHQNGFRGGQFGGAVEGQPAKLADLVVALFLEAQFTDKEITIVPTIPWGWGGGQYHTVVNYVYNVPEVSNAIYSNGGGEYTPAIRKIMIRWMDTRETALGANQAYNTANSMFNRAEDRKKALKYAARVLEADGGQNVGWTKTNILTQFGQQGAKDYLPSIVKCMDDSTVFWSWQNQNPAFDIQVRDMALAVALQLTDQKPEDYDMTRTPGYGTSKEKRWDTNAFAFKDDTPNKNPNGFPGGGPVRRLGRGGGGAELPPEPEKPADPKDPKKPEEKKEKLTQDDRRKAAFAKWDKWVKENVGVDAETKDADARAKWEAWAKAPPKPAKKDEPKAADPKKDEAKPDTPKPTEPKKDLSAEEQKKIDAEKAEADKKKLEEKKLEEKKK